MLAVTGEAVKVGVGAITRPKSLESAKIIVKNDVKHLRGFLWRKMLFIYCETWH